MDSDSSLDDILPEARVFETRIDDIWNETLAAYEGLLSKKEQEPNLNVSDMFSTPEVEEVKPKKFQRRTSPRKKSKAQTLQKVTTPKKKESSICIESLEKMLAEKTRGLSATAKKRMRKIEMQVEQENKRIARETEATLSWFERSKVSERKDIDVVHADDEDPEQQMTLKIRYNSKIQRITVGEREKFSSIFQKLGQLLDQKPHEMLLCHGDTTIKLTDTPHILKLRRYHVIDCFPYKPEEVEDAKDKNKLLLKVQSNDTRKRTEMYIHKLEKFQDLMKRYAEIREMGVENLVFEFDGERIDGTETPSDLDMESGSCIDVRVISFKPAPSSHSQSAQPPIPPSEMLEIYDLD